MADDEIIQEIIDSFSDFALTDIKHNIDRPIAGFILCACLIDQLAGFVYNTDRFTARFQDFVKEYMPSYIPMNLHDTLRNKLLHNYSIGGYYSLTSNPEVYNIEKNTPNTHIILLQNFSQELKDVFEIIKDKFNKRGQTRTNALLWYKAGNKPLIKKTYYVMTYTNEEAEYLISYYMPFALGKTLEESIPFTVIDIIKKRAENGNFILHAISKKVNGVMQPFIEINSLAERLHLKAPDVVLKEKD